MKQITKYLAFIKDGKVEQQGSVSAPEGQPLNIPEADYDEVLEISEELAKGEYPLELKSGKVQKNQVKADKIDADTAETKRINDKVKNKEDISNTELAWLNSH